MLTPTDRALQFYVTGQNSSISALLSFSDGIYYASINDGASSRERESATFSPSAPIATAAPAGAVPEPATWAMMIVGFGAVGASLRARRRTVSVRFA